VPDTGRVLLLLALLVWPLVAFGGRSARTATMFGAACLLSALALRPRVRFRLSSTEPTYGLDSLLVGVVAAIAFQLVPLPASLVTLLSPNAEQLRRSLSLGASAAFQWVTISIDVSSTLWAWIVTAGAIAYFWIAREQFGRGGVRQVARGITAIGFIAAVLAIAQAATAGREIYWRFPTEFEGPLPFGPFVNRNHFATWIIMALPVSIGYLAARTGALPDESTHRAVRARILHAIDARTAWLLAAAATMSVALLLSLSRSGLLAMGLSGAATIVWSQERIDATRRRRAIAIGLLIVLAGLAWADIPRLRERWAGAQTGLADRATIWRETIPLVEDFWPTGTGAGTYQQAMYVYQRSTRTVFFNQAHNHYLQVAAEGGVMVMGLVAAALVALVRTARRRLIGDSSGRASIRLGAACGLVAIALQSTVETGLVMPANAALAGLLAALVVHEPSKP
jgi:hypothetical protein